jgi:glutathione S-transferase
MPIQPDGNNAMQLIGMLDSPYVRRAAISLHLLQVPFEHRSLSVFSTFEQFKAINPVVKAPTLVCDGTVLMDSTLILDYAEARVGRSLLPADIQLRLRCLHIVGVALAACEKAVQIVYERNLRPPEKQYQPWLDRVHLQLTAALAQLETQIARSRDLASVATQASVTSAVTWYFIERMLPEVAAASAYQALRALSAAAEQTPAFKQYPYGGPGVPQT